MLCTLFVLRHKVHLRSSTRCSSPTVKEGSAAVLDREPSLTVGLLHRKQVKAPSTNSRRMPVELHPWTGEVPGSSPGGPKDIAD